MKNSLLAGALILAAGGALILFSGDPKGICPHPCPGKSCTVAGDYCVMVGLDNKPKRVNDKAEAVSISDLSAEKQLRPMVCCVTDELSHQENLTVRWAATVPGNCVSWAEPSVFAGIEMTGVDLGHAKALNKALCGKEDGPASKGNWGHLPHCGYKCVDGRPIATPSGCDKYCNPPEEKVGPIGEWLPPGPKPVPPIDG